MERVERKIGDESETCGLLPVDIRSKLSRVVRTLRQERALTQESLAEASDLSVDTVRRLEAGLFTPSVETLCRICDGLKLSLKTLFARFSGEDGASADLQLLYDYLSRCDSKQLKTVCTVVYALVEAMDRD